jgi:very-short-patch-repair endonuclease
VANLTDAERKLWARLRRRQLDGCKFRHQASIDPYIVMQNTDGVLEIIRQHLSAYHPPP